ncbi:DNA-binding transcriptional regulator UME6 NDAI_0C04790 [Naumovozyma dairenensis CBS 421]|uniref:Zn(2)-C6 fungal-type domain-containing protein n=1 Tax=Naumovozyma dairenensis (strain ATCC 10597 / BCRC 20456 / CBS 421 / NBRC 0211 / NRRL Y-12639) TaxID=1071378 RepID=G0W8M7_NAUDC|nr:hypothetical protein NDAI_0C04790 [Naumovozyma dairenensis CBS 421]CCD24138.1 hypothetical protein NDAI_0C04790 [Naumovozyma dairenensis CBS 421]
MVEDLSHNRDEISSVNNPKLGLAATAALLTTTDNDNSNNLKNSKRNSKGNNDKMDKDANTTEAQTNKTDITEISAATTTTTITTTDSGNIPMEEQQQLSHLPPPHSANLNSAGRSDENKIIGEPPNANGNIVPSLHHDSDNDNNQHHLDTQTQRQTRIEPKKTETGGTDNNTDIENGNINPSSEQESEQEPSIKQQSVPLTSIRPDSIQSTMSSDINNDDDNMTNNDTLLHPKLPSNLMHLPGSASSPASPTSSCLPSSSLYQYHYRQQQLLRSIDDRTYVPPGKIHLYNNSNSNINRINDFKTTFQYNNNRNISSFNNTNVIRSSSTLPTTIPMAIPMTIPMTNHPPLNNTNDSLHSSNNNKRLSINDCSPYFPASSSSRNSDLSLNNARFHNNNNNTNNNPSSNGRRFSLPIISRNNNNVITFTSDENNSGNREPNEFSDIFTRSSTGSILPYSRNSNIRSQSNNDNNPRNDIPSSAPYITNKNNQLPSIRTNDDDDTTNNNDENSNNAFVPPPPPKYINSKLDELRTRMLPDPKVVSKKDNLDLGTATATAAAVLSNMKSSPFRFQDRPYSHSSNNNAYSSRPHSSSFSNNGRGLTNPLNSIQQLQSQVKAHQNQQWPPLSNDNNNINHLQDDNETDNENAFSTEDEIESDDNGPIPPTFNNLNVPITSQVTWNKNGKRINRRVSAPEQLINKKLKKNNKSNKNENVIIFPPEVETATISGKLSIGSPSTTTTTTTKKAKKKQKKSKTSTNGNVLLELIPYKHKSKDTKNETIQDKSSTIKPKKKVKLKKESPTAGKSGQRSRSGCWICRLRKKKCTEERPTCQNCERLQLTCHYEEIKPDFVYDPELKKLKMEEIRIKTREAKRIAMRKNANSAKAKKDKLKSSSSPVLNFKRYNEDKIKNENENQNLQQQKQQQQHILNAPSEDNPNNNNVFEKNDFHPHFPILREIVNSNNNKTINAENSLQLPAFIKKEISTSFNTTKAAISPDIVNATTTTDTDNNTNTSLETNVTDIGETNYNEEKKTGQKNND